MKRVLIFGILASLIFTANAQVLPNAGFESWDSNSMYENPTGYSTSNSFVYPQTMQTNVTKQMAAFSGNYAVTIETVDLGGYAFPGFIMYGDPSALMGGGGGIQNIGGGFPYNQKPTHLVFHARHQCAPSDPAYAVVIIKGMFLGQSLPISFDTLKLTGTQNTFTTYTLPINYKLPISPDTVIIAFVSSNVFNQDSMKSGNWLEVDKLSFTGTTAPIPNNDFEQWDMVSQVEPQGWGTLNIIDVLFLQQAQGVVPVVPGHSGNVAAKITSNIFDLGDPEADTFRILILGDMNSDNPGMAIVNNPDSLTFWYKYNNAKNSKDSGYAVVGFTKFNTATNESTQIDSVSVGLAAKSAFTLKTVRFPDIYGKSPDSMQLIFVSSKLTPTGRGIGNYLIVDDVVLWSHFVGIPVSSLNQENSFVYPNPANDFVNVQFELNTPSDVSITLVDLNGRTVKSQEFSLSDGKQLVKLDLQDVAEGQYLVTIGKGNNAIYSKRIVVRR